MIYGCLYLFIFLAILGSPLWLQILFAIINIAIPDPIPAIDEIVQTISIMSRINNSLLLFDKIKNRTTYIVISAIGIVFIIVALYFVIIKQLF
jgi:hypothetical protein